VRSLRRKLFLRSCERKLLVRGRGAERRSERCVARAICGLLVSGVPLPGKNLKWQISLYDSFRFWPEIPMTKKLTKAERRCHWAEKSAMIAYHDEEWGKPVHDDLVLFEFLILEGAQAGLSWETILNKRENYRKAFDRFDAKKIARYDKRKVRELLGDAGIVRNRLKVAAAVSNAQAFLDVQKEFGSFDRYIWQFVGGKPRVHDWKKSPAIPARTDESDAMSKDLKNRGFRFVGTTICYAFMQATGMVNDHARDCFAR
jgi:DNA-3-methyladenine glycosylase I